MRGLIGKKVGMTSVFDEIGRSIPVTVVEVPASVITQIKTVEKDGYNAVQLANFDRKDKLIANISKLKLEDIVEFYKEYNTTSKLKITDPCLTKYEKTRILGIRIKQLNNNCKPFVSIGENIIDNFIIANKELEEKKLPFIIQRPIPNNTFEYWKLQDLEII